MAAAELVFDPRAAHGEAAFDEVLNNARTQAQAQGLPYAGIVSAQDAWQLVQAGKAVLVDVRTNEERTFVGYVPASLHVAWATGTAMNRNPRFVRELEAKAGGKEAVVVLLCRSGKRSAEAAEALVKAGFQEVYNVQEGFEGNLDDNQHRGGKDGWRFHGLPWVQD